MSGSKKAKRKFSILQKELILREHLEHGLSIAAISRKHQINAVTLYAWKRSIMGNENKNLSTEEAAELEKLKRENDALKKVVADLAVDNTILKQANEILKKKQPTPAWFRSPKK